MSATPSDLADLRRQLDEIDDRMHDLLIERAEIVAQVAARKAGGAGAFYQPAREAQILRRLVARHHGGLPAAAVVRIWREMLAATVRLETPFAVAVFAPAEAQGYWDLARDHYGSHAPLTAYRSPGQVIRAVSGGGRRSASCRCRKRATPTRGGVISPRKMAARRGSSRVCRLAPAAMPAARGPTPLSSATVPTSRAAPIGVCF